ARREDLGWTTAGAGAPTAGAAGPEVHAEGAPGLGMIAPFHDAPSRRVVLDVAREEVRAVHLRQVLSDPGLVVPDHADLAGVRVGDAVEDGWGRAPVVTRSE